MNNDMTEDPTKQNYETAHAWHAEKSEQYDWAPQMERFIASLGAQARVLDIGCGDGRDVRAFNRKGVEVEGLDYSKPAVESLKRQFPEGKFYEASMLDTKLPAASYRGIWASASVLNLKKAEVPIALTEFKRLLIEGGKLFISVKEGEGERVVPDKAGERFFSFFSEEELRAFLQSSGFTIDHTEVINDTFSKTSPGSVLPRWICLYATKI